MSLPIALQLYSVRDFIEKDFEGTLKEVKAMGYDGVEFAGLYGHSPMEVKTMVEKAGLIAISAHVPINDLLKDIPGVVAQYKEIGCKYIAIPSLGEDRRPGHSRYEETIEDIEKIGKEARKQGMVLLYHNHDFEFVKVGEKRALDIMYETVPKEYLETQLDTCWVNVGGEDPVKYIEKYADRAPVVHLKDFVMPSKKPAHMYELIGEKNDTDKKAKEEFEFRPVGYGAQDMPSIIRACEEAITSWVVVEQDRTSMGKTSMECAKMSIDYLKKECGL